jgi:hypothetical protein
MTLLDDFNAELTIEAELATLDTETLRTYRKIYHELRGNLIAQHMMTSDTNDLDDIKGYAESIREINIELDWRDALAKAQKEAA